MGWAGSGRADSRCKGLFEIRGRAEEVLGCTHGPDPAPAGVDVRQPVSSATLAGTAATLPSPASGPGTNADGIACTGDGTTGYRVEAIYAVAGGTDRYHQVAPLIRSSFAPYVEWQFRMSAAETGGEVHVPFVTAPVAGGCSVVVRRELLSAAADDTFSNTISELKARGYTRPDRRYMVWMDSTVTCGIGQIVLDSQPGQANANNGYHTAFARADARCWGYAESHEIMHNLGGVQPDAPHATRGLHCWDEKDEMCYDDDGTGPVVMQSICPVRDGRLFDCNHDDYFVAGTPAAGSYLATHWNTYNSRFLIRGPLGRLGAGRDTVPASLDVNGDGRDDLVHRWNSGVNTWLSRGDGTYGNGVSGSAGAFREFRAFPGYAYAEGVWMAADVNGDGRDDLVHRWNSGVNTWLSRGDGTYGNGVSGSAGAFREFRAFPGYAYAEGVWMAADVNGDGRDDLVHRWNSGVNTWLSRGDGTYGNGVSGSAGAFREFRAFPGYAYAEGVWMAADVNGDGRDDLVHRWNSGVNTWLSRGDGTYGNGVSGNAGAFREFRAFPGYAYAEGVWMAADVNGDGRDDLVHRWNSGVNTWLSRGDGTYGNGVSGSAGAFREFRAFPGYAYAEGVWMAADVNGDGRDDLVHRWNSGVNTWLSRGDGTYGNGVSGSAGAFREFRAFPGYAYAEGVWMAADVNGDGRDDLVHRWNSGVNTWLSRGDGTYGNGVSGSAGAFREFRAFPGYAYAEGVWM